MQYKVIIDSLFNFEGLTIDCGTLHHFYFDKHPLCPITFSRDKLIIGIPSDITFYLFQGNFHFA